MGDKGYVFQKNLVTVDEIEFNQAIFNRSKGAIAEKKDCKYQRLNGIRSLFLIF